MHSHEEALQQSSMSTLHLVSFLSSYRFVITTIIMYLRQCMHVRRNACGSTACRHFAGPTSFSVPPYITHVP